MGRALVIVNKTLQGEDYASTWGVQIGTPEADLTAADLGTLGLGSTISTATTAAAAPTNLLQAIASFERWMSDPAVTINRLYLTDGKRNDLTAVDNFGVVDAAVPGSVRATSVTLAPGAVTLWLGKVPFGFSARPGRLFFRGYLSQAAVTVTGQKLISIVSGSLTQAQTDLATALTNSKLSTYFAQGANIANGLVIIPHYSYTPGVSPKPHTDGQLIGGNPVANIIVKGAAVRQVKRGRREH